MTTSLIVLTLNEVDGIKEIMPKVKKEWVNEVIIVDGNSTDGTIEEAEKLGFRVVIQKNKGHGGAILTGLEITTTDNLVIFGPDGNHSPDEIPQLVKKIDEGFDQVIITRFGKGSINLDAGFIDRFGNKMFAFLANVLFGGRLTDTLNESRIITRTAMKEVNLDAMRNDSTQQMTIRGLKRGHKFHEIIGNEGARVGGKRKINSFPIGALLSKQIIKEFIFWKS